MGNRLHVSIMLFVAMLSILTLCACAVITGQRISWFHDRANNSLQFLIHYDGIHEAKGHGKGTEQIAKLVRDGEVLILDWPGHFERQTLLDRQGDSKEAVLCRKIAAAVEVKVLGYYRAPNGQIGAAQLVTITDATQFIDNINSAINVSILKGPQAPDNASRTLTRMRAAAAKGHEWLALDGHAFRISLPIDHWDWARIKGIGFENLLAEILEELTPKRRRIERLTTRTLAQALTSVPWSYVERRNGVTITLGRRDQPVTLRLNTGHVYNNKLEATVIKHGKTDLDSTTTLEMLRSAEGISAREQSAVLALFPPEHRVRILLHRIATKKRELRSQAIADLRAWGKAWHKEHAYPVAPSDSGAEFTTAEQWREFYEKMLSFPLNPR